MRVFEPAVEKSREVGMRGLNFCCGVLACGALLALSETGLGRLMTTADNSPHANSADVHLSRRSSKRRTAAVGQPCRYRLRWRTDFTLSAVGSGSPFDPVSPTVTFVADDGSGTPGSIPFSTFFAPNDGVEKRPVQMRADYTAIGRNVSI